MRNGAQLKRSPQSTARATAALNWLYNWTVPHGGTTPLPHREEVDRNEEFIDSTFTCRALTLQHCTCTETHRETRESETVGRSREANHWFRFFFFFVVYVTSTGTFETRRNNLRENNCRNRTKQRKRLTTRAGNWLRTVTSDQTVYTIIRLLSEFVGMYHWIEITEK